MNTTSSHAINTRWRSISCTHTHRLSGSNNNNNSHSLQQGDVVSFQNTPGDFTFWISLSLRPKTETEAYSER